MSSQQQQQQQQPSNPKRSNRGSGGGGGRGRGRGAGGTGGGSGGAQSSQSSQGQGQGQNQGGQGNGGGGGGNRNRRRNNKKNVNDAEQSRNIKNNNANNNIGGGGGGASVASATSNQQQQQQQQGATTDNTQKKRRSRNKKKKNDKDNSKNNTSENNGSTTSSKNNNNKNNTKTTTTEPKKKQPTKQELQQIEIQKQNEQKAIELQKLEQQKQLAIQRTLEKQQQLDETISTKIAELTSFTQTTNTHVSNRTTFLDKDKLLSSRKQFQASKKKLKSDLKKCTAFCKKIKSIPNWDNSNVQSMIKDVKTLNLTRYTEEIANAFMECKLKVVDVVGAVEVCAALHERYEDFIMLLLLPRIQSCFMSGSGGSSSSSSSHGKSSSSGGGSPEDAKQKRIYLRFLLELYVNGVLSEAKPIMKIVVEATGANANGNNNNNRNITSSSNNNSNNNNNNNNDNSDQDTNNYYVTDANMVVSFAKAAGHEILGVIPKKIIQNIEFLQMECYKRDNAAQAAATATAALAKSEAIGATNNETDESNVEDGVSQNDDGNSNEKTSFESNEEKIDENLKSISNTNNNVSSDDNEDKTILASSQLLNQVDGVIKDVSTALKERASTTEICDKFQRHLIGAFKNLSTSYIVTHKKLTKLEKRCEQDRLLAGALSEQREKGLNGARKLMDTLRKSVHALAETLNEEVPVLVEEEEEEAKDEGTGVELYKGQGEKDSDLGPFDDEETKAFYCDIPDLLTTIPSALLGYTVEDIERKQESNIQKYGSGFDEGESNEDSGDLNESATNHQDFDEDIAQDIATAENETIEDNNENKDAPHYKLMVLLEQELPECNRIDKVDELAEKFCSNHGTSKSSRKRIQKSLFSVPRSRLDLLPYYSRIAAIFDRVFPDIAEPLVIELEKQFHGLARWKKQQSLENRLRNARFIGELTKFRVAPPIVVLRGMRRCLDDFSGYNIDVACCLLESCGRYLHRTRHTSNKIAQLLDTMKRIRKAKHLDERHVALLNSAFYMVQPPQTSARRDAKVLNPLEAYVKDLLLFRLGTKDTSTAFVSKQLLRFPWSNADLDCGALITKYLLKACRKGRYKSISEVASLISNLKRTKPEILSRVTDAVLEELQYAMENPSMRDQQRSIVYAKLLGEMHCQALVSGSIIFDQLYNFVNFDHEIPEALREITSSDLNTSSNVIGGPLAINGTINEDEEMEEEDLNIEQPETQQEPVAVSKYSKFDPRVPSLLDPDTAVFRVKLICTLLDSSSPCLITVSSASKLDKFLAAFQRYLFIKSNLPTDIEFSILDSFDIIDSKMKALKKDTRKQNSSLRFKTWLESHNCVVRTEELDAISEERSRQRLLTQAGLKVMDSENDADAVVCDDMDDSVDDEMSLNSHDNESLDHGSLNSFGDESEDSEDGISLDDVSDEDEIEDESDDDDEETLNEAAVQEDYMRKLEDEAFERELRKLTMDALERGKNTARTVASAKLSDSMPSASQFSRKKAFEQKIASSENRTVALGGEVGMAFKLIKRGHKGRVEAKDIVVPSDTNLVKIATKQDDEAARERDMLKARVLQYEAESADQAFTGDVYMDQTRLPEVRNRQVLTMEDIDRNFGSSAFRRREHGGRGNRTRTLWRSGI